MILCSLWTWCNLEHLVNCYLLFSTWTFLLCKKKHFFKKFAYLFQRLSSTALLETLSLLLLFDILFSWWLGAELALNDHGKDSRRNWVKGSKNIMKSSLGSCFTCPLGIFLNFLFYFNFLVSRTQFKISMEKKNKLLLGVGCASDEWRKVIYIAKPCSFLSAFLGMKSTAFQKLKSPPHPQHYYTWFPELLRVTLQMDIKSLCFSNRINDFHL